MLSNICHKVVTLMR